MKSLTLKVAAPTCLALITLATTAHADHQVGNRGTSKLENLANFAIDMYRMANRVNGRDGFSNRGVGVGPGIDRNAFIPPVNRDVFRPQLDRDPACSTRGRGIPMNYPLSLINMSNGRSLDANVRNMHRNGGWVQTWDMHGRENQQWTLVPLRNGFVKIVNQGCGLVLDAHSRTAHRNGGATQLWQWNGGQHQQWQLVPTGRGEFEILNRACGLALDADLRQCRHNGGRIQLWSRNGQPQQRWRIEMAPPIHVSHRGF